MRAELGAHLHRPDDDGVARRDDQPPPVPAERERINPGDACMVAVLGLGLCSHGRFRQ
jgi:hypothetical protein